MATNMATWEETSIKLNQMTDHSEEMGPEMMLPILVLGLLIRNPNLKFTKKMIMTMTAGGLSLIPQVTALVGTAYLSEDIKAKLNYKVSLLHWTPTSRCWRRWPRRT